MTAMLTADQILRVARHTGADAHYAGTPRGETIRALSNDHNALAVFGPSDAFDTWAVEIRKRAITDDDRDVWTLVYRDLVLDVDDVVKAIAQLDGMVIS